MPEAGGRVTFELPFPPASLSGHNTGHWRAKSAIVKKHREWARLATLEAKPTVPAEGPIHLHMAFIPPNNRGDAINYLIRAKPLFDGIADALGVNDKRFAPSFEWREAKKPGAVVVTL